MKFGITFKGDISLERTVKLCQMAEEGGFEYAWFFDSHVLWQECYTVIAYVMAHTKKIRFGPLVTNPGVRDWTLAASTFSSLAKLSGNRFDVGVGRGDSIEELGVLGVGDFVFADTVVVRNRAVASCSVGGHHLSISGVARIADNGPVECDRVSC